MTGYEEPATSASVTKGVARVAWPSAVSLCGSSGMCVLVSNRVELVTPVFQVQKPVNQGRAFALVDVKNR